MTAVQRDENGRAWWEFTVVFARKEDIEPWYGCESCNMGASGWDWGWDTGTCPNCHESDVFAQPIECNYYIQHPDGTQDNLSDCVDSYYRYGELHCEECEEGAEHTLEVDIEEPVHRPDVASAFGMNLSQRTDAILEGWASLKGAA